MCVSSPNRLGAQIVKGAQGTSKILMNSDFSSGMTAFLTITGGGVSTTLGGSGPPKDIKVRPWQACTGAFELLWYTLRSGYFIL